MSKKDLLGAIEFNEKYYLKDPNHDEIKDGYCLNFVGKNYARLAAGLKTTTLITPDEKQNENNGTCNAAAPKTIQACNRIRAKRGKGENRARIQPFFFFIRVDNFFD